jgi:hypothetical protein
MLLLYQIFDTAPSCISSFMVIRFFRFRRPSLSKGLLAGAIGGLAGGLAKAAAEVIYPPRVEGQPSPPVILVERVLERVGGRRLSPRQQKLAESSVHFAFSAAVGALYGAVAEYWPDATAGQGAAFARPARRHSRDRFARPGSDRASRSPAETGAAQRAAHPSCLRLRHGAFTPPHAGVALRKALNKAPRHLDRSRLAKARPAKWRGLLFASDGRRVSGFFRASWRPSEEVCRCRQASPYSRLRPAIVPSSPAPAAPALCCASWNR